MQMSKCLLETPITIKATEHTLHKPIILSTIIKGKGLSLARNK